MKKWLIISLVWISILLIGYDKDELISVDESNSDSLNALYVEVGEECSNEWWEVKIRYEWWEKYPVCIFPDESYCSLNELKSNNCSPWTYFYYDESIDWNDKNDDQDKTLSKEASVTDELAKCNEIWENIVCGENWNTYFNRCYLDLAGVKEEVKLAKIIDWKCVFW